MALTLSMDLISKTRAMEEKKDESCLAVVSINGRGPIKIEGKFELVSASGEKVMYDGEYVKICGCGRSEKMPICDGTHKL